MFVDDSGSTQPHRAGARERGTVHVLGGMIVHERDLHSARLAINDAKRDLFAGSDPESWELHAYDVWNNRGDFSGEDRSLNLAKKKEVFSRAVEGIVKSGATLASVVIWKNRLPGGLGSTRIRALAWRLLAKRFEAHLGAGGGVDLGMVISDESNRTTEAEIKRALQEPEARIGRHKSGRSLVVECAAFKDSRSEPLIQGADTIAYILQKQCRGDASFSGWFDALRPSMWEQDGSMRKLGIKDCPDPR